MNSRSFFNKIVLSFDPAVSTFIHFFNVHVQVSSLAKWLVAHQCSEKRSTVAKKILDVNWSLEFRYSSCVLRPTT